MCQESACSGQRTLECWGCGKREQFFAAALIQFDFVNATDDCPVPATMELKWGAGAGKTLPRSQLASSYRA